MTTRAINDVIQELSDAGGGTVRFEAGTYEIEHDERQDYHVSERTEDRPAGIALQEGVILEGEGYQTHLQIQERCNGIFASPFLEDVGVRNLRVDGNRDAYEAEGESHFTDCILFYGLNRNATLEGCWAHGGKSRPIHVDAARNATIAHNRFWDCPESAHIATRTPEGEIQGPEDTVVFANHLESCGGFDIGGSADRSIVVGNTGRNIRGRFVSLIGHNCVAVGNCVDGARALYRLSRNRLSWGHNAEFERGGGHTVIGGTARNVDHLVSIGYAQDSHVGYVSGEPRAAGVSVGRSNYGSPRDVTIGNLRVQGGEHGIRVMTGAERITVRNAIVRSPEGFGAIVAPDATGVRLESLTIHDAGTDGVRTLGDGSTLAGVEVDGAGGTGIAMAKVTDGSVHEARVVGADTALDLTETVDCSLRDLRIDGEVVTTDTTRLRWGDTIELEGAPNADDFAPDDAGTTVLDVSTSPPTRYVVSREGGLYAFE